MSTTSLNTRINETVKKDLEEICEWSDRSQAFHTERALKDYLAKEKIFKTMMLESEQDIAEGRTVPHSQVKAWLKSWGTENELPVPTVK